MTPQTMNNIIEFCTPKLSEEDVLKLDEMLARMVPPKALAADAAIKRRQLLALDSRARGPIARGTANGALSVTDKMVLDARLSPAERRERAKPPTIEQSAEVQRMFPHMKLGLH